MPICYIVGAAKMDQIFHPDETDFTIAADAGLKHLQGLGIQPDLIIGDFDSLGSVPPQPQVVCFPPEKDDTDMMLAIKAGLKKGYVDFRLYGGLGGRLDHTLANIQALQYLAHHQAQGFLIGEGMVLTAITNGSLRIKEGKKGILSVFCFGEPATGINLTGLKYPLHDATLTSDMALGISNEFTDNPAEISVKNGTLVILWFDERFDDQSVSIIRFPRYKDYSSASSFRTL